MQSAKTKITECVKQYAELFPAEWDAFKDWSAEVRKKQHDKFATVSKDSANPIDRKLGEVPEALHLLIRQTLTADEWQWFTADGPYRGDYKGPYWFYKTFPVFAVTEI